MLAPSVRSWSLQAAENGVGLLTAPIVSQKIVSFKSDQSYAPTNTSEFFTDEVLQKWNNLMPGTGPIGGQAIPRGSH